jgi:hypothetical protein
MTVAHDFHECGWIDDRSGLDLLDRTRVLCGVRIGPELLPPDIEDEAVLAFRALAAWLEAHTAAAQLRRSAA